LLGRFRLYLRDRNSLHSLETILSLFDTDITIKIQGTVLCIRILMNAIPKVIKETDHQISKSFEKVEKVYEKVIKENQK
jgi:hypothetical protein